MYKIDIVDSLTTLFFADCALNLIALTQTIMISFHNIYYDKSGYWGLIHTYRMVILQNNNNNNNEAKMSLLANRRQLCWIAINTYNLWYLWNGRCVIEERRTNKHHHRDIEWRPKCTTHIIHNNFDRNCFALSRMPPYLIIYVRISTHNIVTHCNYVNKLKHESTCK